MSVFDGLTGKESKGGLVAVASTTSGDTSLAKRFILVAINLPNSIAN